MGFFSCFSPEKDLEKLSLDFLLQKSQKLRNENQKFWNKEKRRERLLKFKYMHV